MSILQNDLVEEYLEGILGNSWTGEREGVRANVWWT